MSPCDHFVAHGDRSSQKKSSSPWPPARAGVAAKFTFPVHSYMFRRACVFKLANGHVSRTKIGLEKRPDHTTGVLGMRPGARAASATTGKLVLPKILEPMGCQSRRAIAHDSLSTSLNRWQHGVCDSGEWPTYCPLARPGSVLRSQPLPLPTRP
jgi:hypothetical protein